MRDGGTGRSIAVAGAGIAGLSAAIALKLSGFQPLLFEREATLAPIGAGIQLGPNATRIMESWNLDLLGSSVEPEAIELRNARSGALLNTIPLKRAVRARYGAPYLTLLRADLQKAMLTRAEELGIPINFGCAVTAAEEKNGSVLVEAGGETHTACALIGADGVNSDVRKIAGLRARRFSAQAVAWRGILPLDAVPAPLRSRIVIWMAPGAHLVHYPVAGGASLNGVLIIDDVYRNDGISEQDEALSYLLPRLAGWAELPCSAIQSTGEWLHWRLSGVENGRGGKGLIQVIGDAWHAMLPYLASGGVMAIEDAAALAGSVTAAEGNLERALKRFRMQRARRVWRVARASAQRGRVYHCPQPFDLLRDLTIRTLSGNALLSMNDWLYAGRPIRQAPAKGKA
ncbi:MAG: FAD-dependent monooxygenase [Rhodomicrobium sp.]